MSLLKVKLNFCKNKKGQKIILNFFEKDLLRSETEKHKNKFDFVREEIEIRLESLKTELEDKAEELKEQLNQIESQMLVKQISEDLIKKNIEDLQLKIDERFKIIFESFNGKL